MINLDIMKELLLPWPDNGESNMKGRYIMVCHGGMKEKQSWQTIKERLVFPETPGQMSNRFDAEIHAYVLTDNHYLLLHKTNRPNV